VKLEQNYRSTIRILRSANALIANNPKLHEKKLWSELGLGEPIHVIPAADDAAEAETVVTRMLGHKFQNRTRFGDYAVLYRGNHQARAFEEQLRANSVPYRLSGGQSFFERSEIKDVLAWLRVIANDDDDAAFIRAITTPKRGVGAQTLARLGEISARASASLFAAGSEPASNAELPERQRESVVGFCKMIDNFRWRAEREPAGQVLDDLLVGIDYERHLYDASDAKQAAQRWKNVTDFRDWVGTRAEADSKTLLEIVQAIALLSIIDGDADADPDAVRLSTLHAAKGLEFPHVFLVGVEEGILPHRESLDGRRVEEERRLMYVGITRAQKSLTLTWCRRRKRAGEWADCEPSRFIGELPAEDVRTAGVPSDDPVAEKESGLARLKAMRAMLAK
jgi:ATP-dependent DNA helicase Rep